jgi:phage tail sheath protein FI
MPVAPTYPGVYIEEIPSGVHTLTGVSTSITAFVGYTARGNVNQPVHIFSFADFERSFGGLAVDSMLSYAVKHFFQNGGGEAYVVRVASGATAARVTVRNSSVSPALDVLDITAASSGTWGNNLRMDVDYATSNPASLFNLRVTELVERDGQLVPGRTEEYRNLSMNSLDPGFVVDTVNAGSQLVTVARAAGLAFAEKGTSESGNLTTADLNKLDAGRKLGFLLNGQGPYEITLNAAPAPTNTFAARIKAVADDVVAKVTARLGGTPLDVLKVPTAPDTEGTMIFTSHDAGERSAIHFINAGSNDAAAILRLGLANGGRETEAAAAVRPAQTGTVGGPPDFARVATGTKGVITIEALRGASTTTVESISLTLWDTPGPFTTPPTTLAEALPRINAALTASTNPLLAGATASLVGGVLRILPAASDPTVSFRVVNATSDTTAQGLGLTTGSVNVARYAGSGLTAWAQANPAPGNDGTAPLGPELAGNQLQKTGIYALERVDLFNLLVMPDKAASGSTLVEAIAYCEKRRAFVIIDAPDTLTTFAQAETWIAGTVASALRSRNSALYFPRLREPDPLMNGIVRSFPAAGALAGLCARTDADRGVWKAPAGTSAVIVGATGLTVNLTDLENGKLNPLGLNCLRTFPVYGTVAWGARTGRGADALADDYKYIPVRRLALFLEESLYRGTQWAVFEPNDEPLWAQIRLNLGAFMHTLFAQGAFKGRTPREAYFVKCDKETTTQNDIDLGRVNIIVGFAPLKPAEFVVIQIQQIAGAIQT